MTVNNTNMSSLPEILYEDNHIIAVNKRSGDIVQGDKTGDTPLSDILKTYIKEKYNKPGNVYLGVTHRLDRPTSGVTLFAKTSKALSRLNELFRNSEIKKTYWAVVCGKPPKNNDILKDHLLKNSKQNKSYSVSKDTKGAKYAELEYTLLKAFDNYSLLEIKPLTGRHHQIRTQLSKIGLPIKGDLKYGSKRSNKDGSIHLLAREIELMHPVKKEILKIIATPPVDVLWKL